MAMDWGQFLHDASYSVLDTAKKVVLANATPATVTVTDDGTVMNKGAPVGTIGADAAAPAAPMWQNPVVIGLAVLAVVGLALAVRG